MEKRDSGVCPDPEVLAAWIDHGLSAPDGAQVEAHLVGCDDCRALVALVLQTHDAMQLLPVRH